MASETADPRDHVQRRLTPRCCCRGFTKEAALLAPLAGRIYHHAPQQNAFPLARLTTTFAWTTPSTDACAPRPM
jgi:hypothetical protein